MLYLVDPLKGRDVDWLHLAIQVYPTFLISDIRALALRAKRQSARMSEIKNVGYTWMALNTLRCNHLMPLRFKGLNLNLLSCHYWVGVSRLRKYLRGENRLQPGARASSCPPLEC